MNKILNNYFNAFSNKDLETLSPLYDFDATLTDWDNTCKGRIEILKANESLFSQVKEIKANVIDVATKDFTNYCRLEIHLDNQKLKVIDVIVLNENGQIVSVDAYKG
jgi:hypothetical protein